MELHPEILPDFYDPIRRRVVLTCKYRAPEPLTIKFVVSGIEQRPFKLANESILHKDGWHGQHVLNTIWDIRETGQVYECHTLTSRGSTLGVLTTDMRNDNGTDYATEGRTLGSLTPASQQRLYPRGNARLLPTTYIEYK